MPEPAWRALSSASSPHHRRTLNSRDQPSRTHAPTARNILPKTTRGPPEGSANVGGFRLLTFEVAGAPDEPRAVDFDVPYKGVESVTGPPHTGGQPQSTDGPCFRYRPDRGRDHAVLPPSLRGRRDALRRRGGGGRGWDPPEAGGLAIFAFLTGSRTSCRGGWVVTALSVESPNQGCQHLSVDHQAGRR